MKRTVVVRNCDDWHGIFIFLRDKCLVISVPENLLDVLRARAAGWSRAEILDEARLRQLIELPIEVVVGPAFAGHTDRAMFRPADIGSSRLLVPKDAKALESLRAACTTLEWEHGGTQLAGRSVTGAFDGERLIAVAGYELWGSTIAQISVITHPGYRGLGFGTAVVSRLTAEALSEGLVPQYRTLEANKRSIGIARTLGFERYATTVAVRLQSV